MLIYRLAALVLVGLIAAGLTSSERVAAEETNVAARVSQYIEALRKNPHPGARRSAAVQLGKAGSEAVTAIPDLIDALQDRGDIPAIAGVALVQIAGALRENARTDSLPDLQKAL